MNIHTHYIYRQHSFVKLSLILVNYKRESYIKCQKKSANESSFTWSLLTNLGFRAETRLDTRTYQMEIHNKHTNWRETAYQVRSTML